MEIRYKCRGNPDMEPSKWKGNAIIIRTNGICELDVSARGSQFHIICGKHKYGAYICIPNWGIGTELAALNDKFWIKERISMFYPEVSPVDIISIVEALAAVSEYVSL